MKPAKKKAAPKKKAARADLGAPIDGFFTRQPEPLRTILLELRALVEEAAPEATSSIKWGMPFYEIDGASMCALGAHRSHVNLILAGPPGTHDDPHARLSGEGKTGRHLKLTSPADLDRAAIRRWLAQSARAARAERR